MPAPEELPPEPTTNPDALAKALEMELIGKRALWQRAKGRRRAWLGLSIAFLLLVLLGGLLAYLYFLPELSRREENPPAARATETNR
ncbi:MAG: hypothetical protein ACREIF_15025 [Chthoniobacterales bacterium]